MQIFPRVIYQVQYYFINIKGHTLTIKFIKKILFLIFFPISVFSQNTPEHDLIISVDRIWDRAEHNAFTSLVDFGNKLYCAFREGAGHVSDINGTIRVIASDDNGQNWYSVAHLFEQGVDLRDPQLSITPDNRIMLNIGGSIYTAGKLEGMKPKVSFSDNKGRNFSIPQNISIDESIRTNKDWLWKATWNNDICFATAYQPDKEKSVQLLRSNDGVNYKYVTPFAVTGGNETTLSFMNDNSMVAIVRRKNDQNGSIGISLPPYSEWNWNELQAPLGGPNMIILNDDLIICATRDYLPNKERKTILAKVDFDGSFTDLLTLPSEGDCSYPGLVKKDNILYISYYSSHEEKTAIYFARIFDFKTGYKSFDEVPIPYISKDDDENVELLCQDPEASIIYTLDGTIPTFSHGFRYTNPINISKSTWIRAIAIRDKHPASKVLTENVGQYIFLESLDVNKSLNKGLEYQYYKGEVKFTSEIKSLNLVKTGITNDLEIVQGINHAYVFSGYIEIPNNDTYTFYLTSNDGSTLSLNENMLINNDGAHGSSQESVTVSLKKGYHKIVLKYFQLGGGQELKLEWSSENFSRSQIPAESLFH